MKISDIGRATPLWRICLLTALVMASLVVPGLPAHAATPPAVSPMSPVTLPAAAPALEAVAAAPKLAEDRAWPVTGPVIRTFQPPAEVWSAGHRGIDIAAAAGTTVVAAAAGTVTWVGVIAGVPSLSITHVSGLRTTYLPVTAIVSTGQVVAAGEAVGVLQAGHAVRDCLHLGLLRGSEYLDPLLWLTGARIGPIRLLPADTTVSQLSIKFQRYSR
ncbi:MAG: peptidoglycan DD-metalloendopeptidase family protein [Propionibacteriaceae bacterium]|jgi:murein DD-endopeptidase MepM/ murein hydrolase activator NlpD|nr:peptidoglycan DD-metalloendopeptidase family protein [Propionibacteriaceae bacterium]